MIVGLLMIAMTASAAGGFQIQTKPALGQVVRASSATIGGTAVPSGGTILSGDILSTATGGAGLVEFSAGNQVELGENSIVTFSGTPDHVLLTVDHGTIKVRTAAPGAVVVETLLCRVDTTGGAGGAYSVAAPSGSTTAEIKSLQGSLDVTEMGTSQTHTVAQGGTWTCPAAAAAQTREAGAPGAGEQAGQAPAPAVSKHSNTGLLVLLIGGGVAGGIAAAAAGGGKGGSSGGPASPSAP
jgi:hypothetical protein